MVDVARVLHLNNPAPNSKNADDTTVPNVTLFNNLSLHCGKSTSALSQHIISDQPSRSREPNISDEDDLQHPTPSTSATNKQSRRPVVLQY